MASFSKLATKPKAKGEQVASTRADQSKMIKDLEESETTPAERKAKEDKEKYSTPSSSRKAADEFRAQEKRKK